MSSSNSPAAKRLAIHRLFRFSDGGGSGYFRRLLLSCALLS